MSTMTCLLSLLLLSFLSGTAALVSIGTSSLHRYSCLSKNCLKASKSEGGETKSKAKKPAAKSGAAKRSAKVSEAVAKPVKVDDPKEVVFRKPEFIDKIATKTGMTKADSESALSAVLDIITEEVSAGKRVAMVGFGTFKLNKREARKGRNPKTGEEIDISASKYPSFIAGKSFKESCNI